MKIAFVIRSLKHLSYFESAIRQLCVRRHRLHLLFDEGWSQDAAPDALQHLLASNDGVTHGWSLRRSDRWREPLFASREVRTYRSYLTRPEQSSFYLERWEKLLPKRLRSITRPGLTQWLLKTGLAGSILAQLECWAPPDRNITQSLRELAPDVVVATPVNMRLSEEVEYVKAARQLGIPTVLPVISWDNLTTKGLIHVRPDLTLVWNETQRAEAMQVHQLPRSSTAVVGSLFFDKWFEADNAFSDREKFCGKVGLDPVKPFVAYLGSSKNIARDESWLVLELAEVLRNVTWPGGKGVGLLVRPHPAHAGIYTELPPELAPVWPRTGALPETADSFGDLRDTLHHAALTIGLNTSGMLDAIIADRACISITPPCYEKTQGQAEHFQQLLGANVLETTPTVAGCMTIVERLVAGNDDRRSERRKFVRDFIRPRGLHRSAGELAARAIELLGSGVAPRHIEAELDRTASSQVAA